MKRSKQRGFTMIDGFPTADGVGIVVLFGNVAYEAPRNDNDTPTITVTVTDCS